MPTHTRMYNIHCTYKLIQIHLKTYTNACKTHINTYAPKHTYKFTPLQSLPTLYPCPTSPSHSTHLYTPIQTPTLSYICPYIPLKYLHYLTHTSTHHYIPLHTPIHTIHTSTLHYTPTTHHYTPLHTLYTLPHTHIQPLYTPIHI